VSESTTSRTAGQVTGAKTLGQVIAVERTLRQRDNDEGKRIKHELQREPNTLGQVKTYTPDDDNAPMAERLPTQYVEVQHRVDDDLRLAMQYAVPAIDAAATKDRTNTFAEADVIVGETVIIPKCPISHLLWLEHYLAEWRGFLSSLPVLTATRSWVYDDEARLYRARPEITARNLKTTVPLLLVAPTDKHPAQTTTVNKETHVGTYETTVLSGAIPEARKRSLIDNCSMLEVAVKDAVARANRTPVTEVHEGEAILNFILG
jgi:hypothetical protein